VEFEPLEKYGSVEPEDVFTSLPTITHVFRPEERMIHPAVSTAFSFVILAPWLLWAMMLLGLGANVRNLFATQYTTCVGGTFLALLAGVLVFYVVYWVRLNLFHLVGTAVFLGPVTAIVGRYALADRATLAAKGF
jgi:oligosaccharyltransferase complex subunit delta (ribophorin II)